MKFKFLFFCLVAYFNSDAQEAFKLLSKKENGDINYLTIKNINSYAHGYKEMLKRFQPIKGQFTVYLFIKEFQGESKLDGSNKMHDLIILKTSKDSIILDGFYYRLGWAEIPSQSMIFRITSENIKLKNNLKVESLEFVNEYESYGKSLDEQVRLEWCKNDLIKL